MVDQPAPQGSAVGADGISFFCPSGHRILVPRSLAGKRGACSKCGVDVTIPLASQPSAPVPAGQPPIAPQKAPPAKREEEPVVADQASRPDREPPAETDAPAIYPEAPFEAGQDNPTALLVARLWAERDHGGIVELHLTGGSVILPEWFETNWSRGTHGVFASQAADGSVTLTAVAWDAIQKIVVRQVQGLPDGMFE